MKRRGFDSCFRSCINCLVVSALRPIDGRNRSGIEACQPISS